MRLLDVKAILDREKKTKHGESETKVLQELDDKTTSYAILSHRWATEVSYDEVTGLEEMEEKKKDEVRHRDGYQKILKACEQASKDGYAWLWVDTCCIDKRSSAELSEAINSMHRWYCKSQKCYAYLHDVDESTFPTQQDYSKFGSSNGWPEWFMRGWTLQELIAPKDVQFFNKDWMSIGTKRNLTSTLEKITRIPKNVLLGGLTSKRRPSVAQIMSWMADRKTTRMEDRAYSLMGLFGVSMPMLYGEGENAFQRLQLEILRVSSDHSIFAWDPKGRIRRPGSVLADDPSYFRDCHKIRAVEPEEFVDELMWHMRRRKLGSPWCIMPTHWGKLAYLTLRGRAHSRQLCVFVVTNAGIQACLPLMPYRDAPSVFMAILACSDGHGDLITIDLASRGSSFYRAFHATDICKTYPEFRTLYLTHHQDAYETRRSLTLDDHNVSYHGFTRCGTFPRETAGDTVTLSSLTDDLVVVIYSNDSARIRFAVGLGNYFGQVWVHVTNDECAANQEENEIPWMVFAEKVYNAMWDARAEYAQSTPDCAEEDCFQCCNNFVKHAHFPRTIRAARVIWGRQDAENFKVMIDIQLCPGCCVGPLKCIVTSNDPDSPDMPGLMRTDHYSHQLELDGKRIKLEECSQQKIQLGDYGDFSDGRFKCDGNIFKDFQMVGIDPTDLAFRPVSSHVSGDQFILKRIRNSADLAVTFRNESRQLALYQPTGLSLPNNEHTVLLLKALSTHLAGKRLVVTVIKCAEFYVVDHMGRRQEQNSDLGSSGGNCSAEPGGFTPLCTIASPETWRREQGCAQRREQFRNIRERFYALVNLLQPSKPHPQPADRLMMDEAIRFFSDTFGCEYLKNYVGEITFFKSLPSMLGPELNSDTAVGMIVKGNDLPARPPRFSFSHLAMARDLFKGKHRFNAAQEPRFQVVLPRLRMRCQALDTRNNAPHRYAFDKRKTESDVKSISQTLSVGLLELISTAYNEADQDYGRSSRRTDQARNHGNHNKKTSTRCMVQEIKDLQEKLDATDDEDEQRALEEDVTGKILWLCWCGMRSEVELLLPQIVDYIRNEGGVEGLLEIGGIIEATHSQPNDDQTHLRRIMADAGAGTSKYQLLLAAQATTILDDKFCS